MRRKIAVSSVDANSGSVIVMNETWSDLPKAVVSSASIPVLFPHTDWTEKDLAMIDGGVDWDINLVSAIHRCREVVDDDSKIIIDIVLADHGAGGPNWYNMSDINTIANY